MAINFISSKETDGEHVIYSKSDKIEIMINNKADEAMDEFFQLLLSRH